MRMKRWRSLSVFVLVLTGAYLYALPSATIFYFANVALHSGLGVLVALGLLVYLFRGLGKDSLLTKFGWLLLAVGAALGIVLMVIGTPHRFQTWLYAHIAFCVVAVILLAVAWMLQRGWLGVSPLQRTMRFALLLVATGGVAAGGVWGRHVAWQNFSRVGEPPILPATEGKKEAGPPHA